jgi:hypothetical protein
MRWPQSGQISGTSSVENSSSRVRVVMTGERADGGFGRANLLASRSGT